MYSIREGDSEDQLIKHRIWYEGIFDEKIRSKSSPRLSLEIDRLISSQNQSYDALKLRHNYVTTTSQLRHNNVTITSQLRHD